MEITGIKHVNFKGRDGSTVVGVTLWLTYPLDRKYHGEGNGTEKVFLSESKIKDLPFQLALGLEVTPLFNKFGKVAALKLLNAIDFGNE